MEFVKVWLKEIVVLFLIISLIDIILPKGKMKRYVDFIIGILIIFTIISPLTRFNNLSLDLDSAVTNFDEQIISANSLADLQNNQVKDIYTNNLKAKIKALIEDNGNYDVKDINLATLPDDERSFVLDKINIILSIQDEINKTFKVEKVEISKEAIETTYVDYNSNLIDLVAGLVQIEPDKINITIIDEGD